MEMIDLSREIYHRTQTHPSHPPVVMTVWNDHSERKVAGGTTFTSKALSIAFSDHAGTHVDAPVHSIRVPRRCRSIRSRSSASTPPRSASTCRTCP